MEDLELGVFHELVTLFWKSNAVKRDKFSIIEVLTGRRWKGNADLHWGLLLDRKSSRTTELSNCKTKPKQEHR